MIAAVLLAHLADTLTFLLVMRVPGISLDMELNPLARYAYESQGAFGIFALKIVGVTVMLLLLPRVSRPRLRKAGFLLAVAVGLTGAIVNTLTGLLV